MSRIDLERVREWANAKLSGGRQCRRAEQQYMKLSETVDAILAKVDCVTSEPASGAHETPRQNMHLRLVWSRPRRNTHLRLVWST
jgi:hypothetical protein